MTIRKSTKKDIDTIMQILFDARGRIGRLGIDQWQYGYPTRDIVNEDLEFGRSYVGEENGKIIAVFSVISGGEPTYYRIYDGAWLSGDREYLAVHRIAVAKDHLRAGVASKVMKYVLALAKEAGCAGVRIDTHEGNIPMRRMLEKNDFIPCGFIYLLDGQKRIAFERLV